MQVPGHLCVVWCFVLLLRHLGLVISFILILDVINTDYTVYFTIVALCVKLDPGTHKGIHSALALKLGVIDIGAMLTIGRKPRVDWTFLRTHCLQNYFSKL
jgi:hypothetical protein